MREAEIALADEICVNGQPIGRMDGFRLVPAQQNKENPPAQQNKEISPAPNSGADEEAAQDNGALEQEYALRAERFAAAPNGDMAVSQDGSVRWRGQLIAKLKATDDILRPQAVLLADAALSGAAREKVEARLARFVGFHFETACKPLYDLAAAEALFEKPRFVALKIVEHLGVVPRRDIAVQIKELEQESRAALRRLGVRFGVYHIFMPMLLKPAAAQGLTLLWALRNAAMERPGYGDVISYLAAGRTSFAADESFDRQFYRLAGYRLLGKKAVRIDMLERCADLIRQAVSWTPAANTARPDGAYDGRHFTISQAMLSILGATPEDMEEMLQQLGYVSHSVSAAEYKTFLNESSEQSGQAAEAVPAAEPVGDWQNKAPAEAAAAHEDSAADKSEAAQAAGGAAPAAAEDLPQAEPVGPKFSAKRQENVAAEHAAVLLWRYQKRSAKKPPQRDRPFARGREQSETGEKERRGARPQHRHGHQTERTGGQDRARKDGAHRDTARQNAGQGEERRSQNRRGEGRPPFGRNTERKSDAGKSRNFSGKSHSKPVNIEDSPFAALLALRDKMKK